MDKVEEETPYPRVMGNKSTHALKLQQHLYDQMLSESEFCDVTLDIGYAEMKAHWNVLVSCPYFQSLYDSDMKEKKSGNVKLSVGKTAAVRSAITFLYTGQLEISYSSVKDILEVADYLQIDDLKQECESYLTQIEVTVNNCVSLCLLASLYDLDIYSKVYNYLRGHLPEVMKQAETLSLTPESVLELLKDPSLNYVALEDFFNFIVIWVEHDLEKREKYFERMFCELDLKKMPADFLVSTVELCPLVQGSKECSIHVLNVKMKDMAGLLQEEEDSEVALVVGGCGVGQFFASFISAPYFPLSDVISVNNVYGYIMKENRWTELAPLPYTMRRPLVAYNKGANELYVYDASVASIENEMIYLFKYNVVEKSWTSLRVSLPENMNEVTIQQIVCCSEKIYLVASSRTVEDCATRSDWSVCLFRLSDDGDGCEMKWKLFPRSTKTQVSACVVDDRYVCVLGFKCGIKTPGGGTGSSRAKVIRFLYLDTLHNKKCEFSRGAYYEQLMLPMKNELLMGKPGVYRYRKFSFNNRRWITVKEQLVPHPTEDTNRTDFLYTVHEGQLLMFGGKHPTTKKLVDSALSLNLRERGSWNSIQALPKALIGSGVVMAKIPKNLIRCHIDCPHCLYHSVRSQASYQIQFPDNDDDDDDYSDPDDEIYSDYWDDEMYDNIPDYDWF